MVINNSLICAWQLVSSGKITSFPLTFNQVYNLQGLAKDLNPEDSGLVSTSYSQLTNTSAYWWTIFPNITLTNIPVNVLIIGI